MSDVYQQLTDKLASWGDGLVLMLPNMVAAVLVLVASWLISRLLSRLTHRLLARISNHRSLNDLVSNLVRIIGVAIGFVVALQILRLDKAATTFLAGAGLIGLALGFAFQDMSANFIAGIYIAIKRRPIRVGDIIETNEYFGTVERIQLRTTLLRQMDGRLIRIPNRKIFENALIDFSELGRRRLDLEVGVSYGEDLAHVQRVTREAVETIERAPDRDVEIFFTGFGDSSINLVARVWIEFRTQRDYMKAQSDAVMAIKSAYDRAGITIPFPIRTLDFGIKGGETLREQIPELERAGRA